MIPYEKISLRQIESFYHTAKNLSFTKASEVLYISQPTVSEHISCLERILGVSLFERLGKRIRLTEAGRIYLEYCERMLRTREEAHYAIEEFIGLLRGNLLIGASSIPANYILPQLLSSFKKMFRGIRVSMRVGDSADIENVTVNGDCHLGFIGRRPENRLLRAERFADDEVVLIAPPDSEYAEEVSIQRLKELPLLVREEGSATLATFYKALKHKRIDEKMLNIAGVLGSTEAIKRATRAGMGVGVVSLRAVRDEVTAGFLKIMRIKGLFIKRGFFWIYRVSSALPPAAHRFIKMLRDGEVLQKLQLGAETDSVIYTEPS